GAALPLAPFASDVELESKLCSTLEQPASAHTWKLTLPVSLPSGSLNVADSAGVALLTCAPLAGATSAGTLGPAFAVEFVTDTPAALAAALPTSCAVSRIIGFVAGLV